MSQRRLTTSEIQIMQEALNADSKSCGIRLRKGEYQHSLATTIASFQLELYFPNVKDIIRRSYGEEQAEDVQFIRKIQTILKKMERNNVVKILAKEKPWELQRYAVSGFRFQDVDRNRVALATEAQIEQLRNQFGSILGQKRGLTPKTGAIKIKVFVLVFSIIVSYAAILWDLMQTSVNPVIFISSFSFAVVFSLMLGKVLSER